MKYALHAPNFGTFSNPRAMAKLAREGEEAGWDGFFSSDDIAPWHGVCSEKCTNSNQATAGNGWINQAQLEKRAAGSGHLGFVRTGSSDRSESSLLASNIVGKMPPDKRVWPLRR